MKLVILFCMSLLGVCQITSVYGKMILSCLHLYFSRFINATPGHPPNTVTHKFNKHFEEVVVILGRILVIKSYFAGQFKFLKSFMSDEPVEGSGDKAVDENPELLYEIFPTRGDNPDGSFLSRVREIVLCTPC